MFNLYLIRCNISLKSQQLNLKLYFEISIIFTADPLCLICIFQVVLCYLMLFPAGYFLFLMHISFTELDA